MINSYIWVTLVNACIALATGPGFFSDGGKITDVDAFTFKQKALDSRDVAVVVFYANWCPFSKDLRPEYVKLADQDQSRVVFLGVDCADYYNFNNLCKRFELNDYPDIKIFVPRSIGKASSNRANMEDDKLWRSRKLVLNYKGQRNVKSIQEELLPIEKAMQSVKQFRKRELPSEFSKYPIGSEDR